MVGIGTLFRYVAAKHAYSVSVARKSYREGNVKLAQVPAIIWKNLVHERMTMLFDARGNKWPSYDGSRSTGIFLVRKIPEPNIETIHIGDVVVHKDPTYPKELIARKIAAVEGSEIFFENWPLESFQLVKDTCWVLVYNEKLKVKQAHDSRSFGPIYMRDIVGRAVYHHNLGCGAFISSELSVKNDSAVIAMELDIEELKKKEKDYYKKITTMANSCNNPRWTFFRWVVQVMNMVVEDKLCK